MKKLAVILIMAFLLTGCSKVSEEEYNSLKSEVETLKSDNEVLQKEKDTLQTDYNALNSAQKEQDNESGEAESVQANSDMLPPILTETLKIDREFSSGFIGERAVQINYVSKDNAKNEMKYFENALSENPYVVTLLCGTYEVDYLYLKIVGDSGEEMFEFYYNLLDEEVTMSIGVNYMEQIL